MADKLPYFKFFIADWLLGRIQEHDECKGVFQDICAWYWKKNCELSLDFIKNKFKNRHKEIEILIENKIIEVDRKKNITIKFLIKQYKEQLETKTALREGGRKGGLSSAQARLKVGLSKQNRTDLEQSKPVILKKIVRGKRGIWER